MKIYRFSVFLIFVTLVALLYVHQQVQLLDISYRINSKEREIARLLDQNRILVYNATRLKSSVYLDKKFLSEKDYLIPQQWQVVKVERQKKAQQPVVTARLEKRPSRILKIFGRPREAMANTMPNAATQKITYRHPED